MLKLFENLILDEYDNVLAKIEINPLIEKVKKEQLKIDLYNSFLMLNQFDNELKEKKGDKNNES
jgi:hypothetical protein